MHISGPWIAGNEIKLCKACLDRKIEFFLFWEDWIQVWIKDQIFIIAKIGFWLDLEIFTWESNHDQWSLLEKIWSKFVNLIHSRVHIEHWQTKSTGVGGVRSWEKTWKNSTKVAIWFHSSRLFQAIPSTSFVCWASKDSIPTINKHFRVQIRTVSIPRTPCFLEIESHKFGIVSMICLYILNPWNIAS